MAISHSVSVTHVREELNDLPASVVSDATIQRKIGHAAVVVGEYAGATPTAEADTIDYAVTVVAAHDVLTSDTSQLVERAQELDISETYNVEQMAQTKAQKRAEALALVSPSGGGPSLHALGDRYPP